MQLRARQARPLDQEKRSKHNKSEHQEVKRVEDQDAIDLDSASGVEASLRRSWRALRHVPRAAGLLALFCLPMSAAWADIWGYVDSDRMPHFASSRLDERYEIFLRESEKVEPFHSAAATSATSSGSLDASAESASSTISLPSTTSTTSPTSQSSSYPDLSLQSSATIHSVSPKMLNFFERSKNYKAVSPLLLEASKTHGIDYSLLKALITTESGFNPDAVSPKGAVGLMQLIPPTAQRYGVTAGKNATIAKKLTDPRINISAGARYLADLIKMFPGQLELALAAYNAGEGAVQRAGNKIPNFPETQNYVKTVMQLYNDLAPAPLKAATGRIRMEIRAAGISRGNTPSLTEPASALSRGE